MTIGSITVDLLARTGSFETDLNRSAKLAAKRAKEIDDAVSKAGERVGASLAAAGVAAVFFGKKLIDGLDALNDYKDATGASIENLSALEDVAGRTGAGMDTVSGILTKFNSVLKEADGKNGASQALKAIGLSAEELKRLDPAEALRVTAVALSNFADDGNKARLMQELFGKSVKEAAPFLNDLAAQTELVGKVTAEQTQAAEDFNKSLFALQKNAADAGRALLKDLLPSMNEIIKAFNSGGLRAGIDAFGNQILDWEGNAQRKGIANLKKEIESLQQTVERPGRTAGEIVTVRPQDVEDLARLRAALKQAEQGYYKFNAAAGGGRGAVNPDFVDPRKSIGDVPKPPKAGAAKESEYQKYLENLGKQLDKTKELTVAEMVLADISSGRLKLGKGERVEPLLDVARQVDAAKAMEEYKKLSVSAEEARAAALAKTTIEQEGQALSLKEGNKSTREEIELLGKSAEAQAAIEQARITSAIAIKEEELVRRENAGALIRETDAIRAQIAALTERKDLVGLKQVAEKLKTDADEAKAFATQVGAAFESSFEKAVLGGGKLSDVIQGLGKDVAALWLRNSVTGPLAKSLGDVGGKIDFGGIFKSIGGLFGVQGFADGGEPPVGRVSLVGENGPELFVPKTAGTIIPNHALGSAGGGMPLTIINKTTGRVDRARVEETPQGTTLTIEEVAAQFDDPNSKLSKAYRRNYSAERVRA
jgi:hypothetical protein